MNKYIVYIVFIVAVLGIHTPILGQIGKQGAKNSHISQVEIVPDDVSLQKIEAKNAWDLVWTSQQVSLKDILLSVQEWHEKSAIIIKHLQESTASLMLAEQRLFVLCTAYAQNPTLLVTAERALLRHVAHMHKALESATEAQKAVQYITNTVHRLQETAPQYAATHMVSADALAGYTTALKKAAKTLARLEDALVKALAPGHLLVKNMDTALQNINAVLPSLWEKYYSPWPFHYTDTRYYSHMWQQLRLMGHIFLLRMNLELPQNRTDWLVSSGHFFFVISLGAVVFLLIRRKQSANTVQAIAKQEKTKEEIYAVNGSSPRLTLVQKMSTYSMSLWSCILGFACIAASLSTDNSTFSVQHGLISVSYYGVFFNIGVWVLLWSYTCMAWSMRYAVRESVVSTSLVVASASLENTRSSFSTASPLSPLTFGAFIAYALLYPDMPLVFLALSWSVVLIIALIIYYKYPISIDKNVFMLEKNIFMATGIMLWVALLGVLLGFPRISILLYIIFTALAVGIQWCVGTLSRVHTVAKHMSTGGSSAMRLSLLVTLAAPASLLVALLGSALWFLALPGGTSFVLTYMQRELIVGKVHISFLQILLICSIFYITYIFVRIGSRFIRTLGDRGFALDASFIPPLQTVFSYGTWGILGLCIIKFLGMDLTSLAVVAGGLSVGIGFGMQTIVNNFFSGLILIFSRILQEGDVINVAGLDCTVRKINIRATTVETHNGAVIYVPNAEFVSNRLINWTRNSRSVRREISIGVAYGTDTELVMKLLRTVAEKSLDVLKYPSPYVLFTDFGDSTLNFLLRFWVTDYKKRRTTSSALRVEIEKVFREHNIEISFPQLDVHIKNTITA